ncbi:MAG: hypothetical protein KAU20_02330 [Nanoarchaeota archaeon]|nr:hypothetical protein [Nanoarchaeota archaeon]
MAYKKGDKNYIIFDARFTVDPERAAVLMVCDDLEDAKEYRADVLAADSVIVENEFINSKQCEATGLTW